jgi:hypothetical protein
MSIDPSIHSIQLLHPDEMVAINGGMFAANVAQQVITKSTRMGDGTVQGQQWYKDHQQADAAAKTAAAVAAAKANTPNFDKIVKPPPFTPRPVHVPKFTSNPFPGHPQMRKG